MINPESKGMQLVACKWLEPAINVFVILFELFLHASDASRGGSERFNEGFNVLVWTSSVLPSLQSLLSVNFFKQKTIRFLMCLLVQDECRRSAVAFWWRINKTHEISARASKVFYFWCKAIFKREKNVFFDLKISSKKNLPLLPIKVVFCSWVTGWSTRSCKGEIP